MPISCRHTVYLTFTTFSHLKSSNCNIRALGEGYLLNETVGWRFGCDQSWIQSAQQYFYHLYSGCQYLLLPDKRHWPILMENGLGSFMSLCSARKCQWCLGNSGTFSASVFSTEIVCCSPSHLPSSNQCILIESIIKFSASKCLV